MADEALAVHGLCALIQDDGLLEIKRTDGITCVYSSRGWASVAFPSLEADIRVRLIRLGVAEVELDGQVFVIDANDDWTPVE